MSHSFDEPGVNDNRSYNYENNASFERVEYPIITDMVERNAKIIDLGCGNGSLIEKLIKEKNVTATGMEISKSGVEVCRKKGLDVTEGRIDEKLPFADNSFDYAICNVTIQMVMYPEVLLKEMVRISHFQIVSFPNFAYWKNRLDLLIHGRMPRPMLFGYKWYETGHIHQFSVKDFFILLEKIKYVKISKFEDSIGDLAIVKKIIPNLFLYIPIYFLSKND